MLQHFSQPACTSSSVGEARAPSHGGGGGVEAPRDSSSPLLPPCSTWQILHQTGGFGGGRLVLVGGAGRVAHEGSLLPGAAVVLIGHFAVLVLEKDKETASATSPAHSQTRPQGELRWQGTAGQPAQTCQPQKPLGNLRSILVQLGESWHRGRGPTPNTDPALPRSPGSFRALTNTTHPP